MKQYHFLNLQVENRASAMVILVTIFWVLLNINLVSSRETIFRAVEGCESNCKHPGVIIQSENVTTVINCLRKCGIYDWCTGANIGPNIADSNSTGCDLLTARAYQDEHVLVVSAGYSYFEKEPIWSPCLNGGTFHESSYTCTCSFNYTGQFCHRHFYDCTEATDAGRRVASNRAVMMIQPLTSPHPFAVSCLLNWGGYTHIELRSYGPNDFGMNRTWDELKYTLGEPGGDHWLGLEYIHQITSQATYDLDIMVSHPLEGHPIYTNFKLSDEDSGYRFSYDAYQSFHPKPADDGFSFGSGNQVDGQPFATFDRPDPGGCAVSEGVAWWYSSTCPSVNLHQPLYDSANPHLKHATWVSGVTVTDVVVVVLQVRKTT